MRHPPLESLKTVFKRYPISKFSAKLINRGFSMVRVETLRKRLNKLDEYLEILRGLQRYEQSETLWFTSTSTSTKP
jgi:hypothetical protein